MAALNQAQEAQSKIQNPKSKISPYGLLVALGLGLAGALLLLTSRGIQDSDFRGFLTHTDFPAFLTGARLVAAGQGAALYDPAAQAPVQAAMLAPHSYPRGLLPYNHLPFLAVALAPAADLPLPVSYGLWWGATLAVLLAALGLLGREMAAVARTPAEARWAPRALWALSFGLFPVYQSLLQAQTPPWDLLGYTLLVRYLRQGRDVAAGLALALGLVKPQLLIVPLLVLLYTRRWRVLGSFVALTAALSLLVTPLLGGFGWIGRYLLLLGNVATAGADTSMVQPSLMENLRGLFTLLALHYDPAAIRTGQAGWVLLVTALSSGIVLAGLLWTWRGRPGRAAGADPAGWDRRWAATLLAALLVNPHGFSYELVLLLLPGVLAWRAAREPSGPGDPAAVRRTALLLVIGYLAASLTLPLLALPAWPLHLGVLFMLVALALLCVSARRPARFHIA